MPGDGPLGGEILSHDFVEAALIRRAGWKVCLAHDLNAGFDRFADSNAFDDQEKAVLAYAEESTRTGDVEGETVERVKAFGWTLGNLHVDLHRSRLVRSF